jgi:hypothetical protein
MSVMATVVFLGAAVAHEPRNTLVPPGVQRYQPTPFPDRIVLNLTQDPARSQTVNWRTAASVEVARAQITEAVDSVGLHLSALDVLGDAQPVQTENGLAHHHSVTFDDLLPDTLYAFRVRGDDTWSEWFQFRTAKAEPEPFTFVYFGDAQNSVLSHFSRVIREAMLRTAEPAFMLHAGDLVNLRDGIHDDEWGEWFDAGSFLYGMVPNFVVAGNHEYVKREDEAGDEVYQLSELFPAHFRVPANGPAGFQDTVYYVEYQGVLFVALDSVRALQSEQEAIAQAQWLDALLTDRNDRWIIISHHHPMNSVSLGRDNPPLRQHWQPLYQKHGVDMVLQGHDHTYGRGTNVPEGAMLIDDEVGTVYVVSVAGPKMYLISDQARDHMDRLGEDVQLYQILTVEADRIRFESRTAIGHLYDAFHLVRQADGRNVLEEKLPPGQVERLCTNPDRPRPTRCWEGRELVD